LIQHAFEAGSYADLMLSQVPSMLRPITVIQTVAFKPYLYRYADPGPYKQADVTRIVIRGGAGEMVGVGILILVGVKVSVRLCSSVGDGVFVTGIFTRRVTSNVSTRVTSLVTSTVWLMYTGVGKATVWAQETPIKTIKHKVKL
jgi:hypothetical protein